MKWRLIPKDAAKKPKHGKYYWHWKDDLADEGFNQCVYCAIHESSFGRRNYHIEHFKPKSIEEFQHLIHEYGNLYFACCICNCFKASYWEEPKNDFSNSAFPNPSQIDYSQLFQINEDATISGKNVTGNFIIHKLYLNRPQLVLERKLRSLNLRIESLIQDFADCKSLLFEKLNSGDKRSNRYLQAMMDGYENLHLIRNKVAKTIPYTSADTKRQNDAS